MARIRIREIVLRCAAFLVCIALCMPDLTRAQGADDEIEAFVARMSPLERVGQLFIVGLPGTSIDTDSAILTLIAQYRIGGVVLTSANLENAASQEKAAALRNFALALQEAALSPATSPAPASSAVTPTGQATEPTPAAAPVVSPVASETIVAARSAVKVNVPLFVGFSADALVQLASDLGSKLDLSPMALGATWDEASAGTAGRVVGQALQDVGVNLFFGPVADLATPARAGLAGDLNVGTFGESPFWVGRMSQAYADGLRVGSEGTVLAIAAHFPGWGAADRFALDEVPVVQGSLESHLQTDLLPFRMLLSSSGGEAFSVDGLLASHVQFRGVTSGTQMTRPASLDPQAMQYFLDLPDVAPWRKSGGLVVSDSLGALSIRRLYDPQLKEFSPKRVAYDAFMAGNDLLQLDAVGVNREDWTGHFANVTETVEFFHSKYLADSTFRSRVDESVRRILSAKRRLYSRFALETVAAWKKDLSSWNDHWNSLAQIARASVTLVYPKLDEMLARVPDPPSASDRILVFEDVRSNSQCDTCEPLQDIAQGTIASLLERLYGQLGTGHIDVNKVESFAFADLWAYLQSEVGVDDGQPAALEKSLGEANWLIFLTQGATPDRPVSADALREFLRKKGDLQIGKKIVVISCGAPYYLDSTDFTKTSALYAVYSTANAAIEAGLRVLFREYVPTGVSPVSIPGAQYSIPEVLQPAVSQLLYAELQEIVPGESPGVTSIRLGDTLALTTGLVRDANGHMVPDGTEVSFAFSYPAQRISWQQSSVTAEGKATTTLQLDTPGTLEVSVTAGKATRTAKLLVMIEEDKPVTISTIVPTPAPTTVPTEAPGQLFTGEPVIPPATAVQPWDLRGFVLAIIGLALICLSIWSVGAQRHLGWLGVENVLLALCAGMIGYLAAGLVNLIWGRAGWLVAAQGVVPWRWQSVLCAWLLGGIVGVTGLARPSWIAGAARFFSQSDGQEALETKRDQKR